MLVLWFTIGSTEKGSNTTFLRPNIITNISFNLMQFKLLKRILYTRKLQYKHFTPAF